MHESGTNIFCSVSVGSIWQDLLMECVYDPLFRQLCSTRCLIISIVCPVNKWKIYTFQRFRMKIKKKRNTGLIKIWRLIVLNNYIITKMCHHKNSLIPFYSQELILLVKMPLLTYKTFLYNW